MPDSVDQILTRLQPGKFDAKRAKNFDVERAKGALVSSFKVERILNLNEDARTADFAFASDEPIEHFFGNLILDVSPDSVDLSRVENGVCPFLVNHNTDDLVGVVVPGSVSLGPVIRGTVKFSQSERGQEILRDVKDEVRNGVSVGFQIDDMILVEEKEGEMPLYRATRWVMLENSTACIPADYKNVGAGRTFEKHSHTAAAEDTNTDSEPGKRAISTKTEKPMAKENDDTPGTPVETRTAEQIAAQREKELIEWAGIFGEDGTTIARNLLADRDDVSREDVRVAIKESRSGDKSTKIPPVLPGQQPAQVNERFTQAPTIGEQIVNSEAYKKIAGRAVPNGLNMGWDIPGTVRGLTGQRSTFTSTGTGADTTVNYLNMPVVLVEQQRLMVRDLLAVGETNQAAVTYIKETSFTNYADMTAEEGEKPEASFATSVVSAPVRKIAVVAKVTDEMWNDFPMLRDYINGRLRFMVEAKEEQQLLNGTGSGNQITGILQTSGIQTQACGSISATNPVSDSILKAITKIRSVGFFEPDGIVIHPTDYQILKLAKDANYQYYGGGPFTGQYGVGGVTYESPVWGLKPVITTAIAAGTALVGAFKLGSQIWQRDGIRVDSTNTNEDDFNFNRVSLRVEERLALAVYRPLAFCTVTSIA